MTKTTLTVMSLFLGWTSWAVPDFTVELTTSGYAGQTELKNFPVLVRISPEKIPGFYYKDCGERGADISFTLENGAKLAYEIDTWNVDGESLVWVKLPSLTKNTKFKFGWSDKTPGENNPSDVWSEYEGVWHMTDPKDSTKNEYDAVGKNVEYLSDSLIGGAVKFDGQSSLISENAYTSDTLSNNGLTVTAWCDYTQEKANRGIFGIDSVFSFRVQENLYLCATTPDLADHKLNVDLSSGRHCLAVAFAPNAENGCVFYVDGEMKVFNKKTSKVENPSEKTLYLGGNQWDQVWSGPLDEVRFSLGSRSAEWIKAEYDTVKTDFIAYGEVKADATMPSLSSPSVAVHADGSVTFSVLVDQNIPISGSVTVTTDGKTHVMETAGGELPLTYSVTVSKDSLASDTTYSYSFSAKSQSGTEIRLYDPGALFYTGVLVASVVRDGDARAAKPAPVVFKVSRADTAGDLEFNYTLGGTAQPGINYVGPTVLSGIIPDGESCVEVLVDLIQYVGAETSLSFAVGEGRYIVNAANSSATARITALEDSTAFDYIIENADGLKAIAQAPNARYKLAGDINLTDAGYESVPCFRGVLDGGGYVITGLSTSLFLTNAGTVASITLDGTKDGQNTVREGSNVGMFCNVSKAGKFTDCIVRGYTLKCRENNKNGIGFFVSEALDGTEFLRCQTDSSCIINQASKPNNSTGGFVGVVKSTLENNPVAGFTDCTNRSTQVLTGNNNGSYGHGGFVGRFTGSTSSSNPELFFFRCVNFGSFEIGENAGNLNVAGLVGLVNVGQAKDKSMLVRAVGCVNAVSLETSGSCIAVGGLLGSLSGSPSVTLNGCVNYGKIGSLNTSNAGGMIGGWSPYASNVGDGVKIVNCANYADVCAKNAGNVIGYISLNTGWNNGKLTILNFAGYGNVNSGSVENKSALFNNMISGGNAKVKIDNIWAVSSSLYTNCAASVSSSGVQGADADGYSHADALAALNSAASEEETYMPWVAGEGGRPELMQFVSSAQGEVWDVVFCDWDGSVLSKQHVADGEVPVVPAAPSREGFVFASWGNTVGPVHAACVFYAQYRPVRVLISYDSAGGSSCGPISAVYGSDIVHPLPVRDGYRFMGWSEKSRLDEFSVAPSVDRHLTALWLAVKEPQRGRNRSVLHWKIKDVDSRNYTSVANALLSKLSEIECDFLTGIGFNQNGDYLQQANMFGYAATATSSNGTDDGNGRVFAWIDSKYEFLDKGKVMPIPNCTLGYVVLKDKKTGEVFLVGSDYYGTDKSLEEFVKSLKTEMDKLRSAYPTAYFIVGADLGKLTKNTVEEIGDCLVKYGLTVLRKGDDRQYTVAVSPYDPYTLEFLSVQGVVDEAVSDHEGHLTSFRFGKAGGFSLRIR